MKVKRYYLKQNVELAEIQGIRAVLMAQLKWQISESHFVLHYPGEVIEIDDIDELSTAVSQRGKPGCVFGSFRSAAMETVEIETCGPDVIVMGVDGRSGAPDKVFEQIEELMLGLRRVNDRPKDIRSAFIAHAFDDDGRQYAREVSYFLGLLDIKTESGLAFAPQSVSDKVRERLAAHDMFLAIITPQSDHTWIVQECTAALYNKMPMFILKREDVEFRSGILGNLEFIPFPRGDISRTFLHILEGLKAMSGKEAPVRQALA